ncbi:polysaccharide biosynthesis tyrosine autokinase [uncultured Parabacteroides sp.]|uniref:GumC family protein n=1 Tax=uncultured Parabacteroides sp. TaxID=512312 RepID=UPI0026389D37|nr:polysaccharide biosynthesis tyrosine autokinase [uncultured Parabacteroides sp.]
MERYIPATDKRQPASNNSKLDVQDWFFLCVNHWKWFALSLLISMGGAVLYLKMTPKVYTRTTSILIKAKDDSGNASEQQLKELGIMQNSSNITNEILSLQNTVVAREIVRRLNLEINYLHENSFHDEVLYGIDRPISVIFTELNDNETASLSVTSTSDSTVTLSDLRRNDKAYETIIEMKLGESRKTPCGNITVLPTPYYKDGRVKITRSGIDDAANSVKKRISAQLRDKNSTIIDISYRDVSIARAEDVLNTLVSVYNENWIKDRNQITVSTNEFIKDRLEVIEQELGSVEQDISNYKSENLMPDVQQVGSLAMTQANTAEQESNTLSNQIYMVRYIRSYLMDGRHENQLLPSNSGVGSSTIGRQIEEYNEILLRRNNHLANSSLQNPLVMDLNQHLATLRHTIIQSLDNELAILNVQQQNIRSNYDHAVAKIASNPQQAKYLLSVERQQKVKESLYLFLLQKREENELSQAFTAYNTRLIEPPHGSMAPTEPIGSVILFYAFCFGLGLPICILFGKEYFNTSVRRRDDLKNLRIPFIGEIPFVDKRKKVQWPTKSVKQKAVSPHILVEKENRDLINEAFRVVRTNLEFVLGFEDSHRVIMLTSINPGSGKTFITANLSNALGIKDKKVLAIDLDLRKGTLSEYVDSPQHGVSNYLSGQEADYRKLVIRQNCVDILPCGTLPPNPTELLFVPRFQQMMEEVRQEYDYVFVDCPPVEIVADAAIVNRYADQTLFIIRAGMFERNLLSDVESWYDEKRYNNLSIILNATKGFSGYYRHHKYGYSHGNGYVK